MESSTLARMGVSRRRSWRFVQPGQQIRLVVSVLGITLAFGLLLVANSYAAYGALLGSALSTAPPLLTVDVEAQTHHYMVVTLALAGAYAFVVIATCVAFVHRLVGPNVALVRHARALKLGDFSSRVTLRERDGVYAELVRHLNDLAARLEREQIEAGGRASALDDR